MSTAAPTVAPARPAGFVSDLAALSGRSLRQICREPAAVVPYLIMPAFLFFVSVGALEKVAHRQTGIDFKAFELPFSTIFAVTGASRALSIVVDIQGGYFDRLCVSPVRRITLLLGVALADLVLAATLTIPVLVLGYAAGVRFSSGPGGVIVFVAISAAWGLAFTGFPYAVALRTGNPIATASTNYLFFPFAFLTSAYVPREALSGWLSTVAAFNPVTYLLDGLRSLILSGWDGRALLRAVAAVAGVGLLSGWLALRALDARVRER